MRTPRAQVLTTLRSAVEASPKLTIQSAGQRVPIEAQDRDEMLRMARAASTRPRIAMRTVVVLLAGAGWKDARIAAALGVSRRTVALWRTRFAAGGMPALLVDAPGRGRKPGRNREIVERIRQAMIDPPANGVRWTVRTLARAVGVSHATVHRVWRDLRAATLPPSPARSEPPESEPPRSQPPQSQPQA